MLYFAYGSNMLKERIRHPLRVPGARWLKTGYVTGRKLAFHKRSQDGSGKCDVAFSDNPSDRVYGVVYDVPEDQVPALDKAEALGAGYRRGRIEVFCEGSPSFFAETYLADPNYIDPTLCPYTWYKELVLQGARQNHLSADIIEEISAVSAWTDPDSDRATAIEASEALKACRASLQQNRSRETV